MSGIAGIVNFDLEPVSGEQLNRMLTAMGSADLHDTAHHLEGEAGLGQVSRKTNIEAGQEKLPLVFSNQITLVFDGRFDNKDELLHRLGITQPHINHIHTSELLLAAYLKWGQVFLEYILGDFALAIWDANKQQLLCARDPMGVKPFYYCQSNRLFMFASNPDAILMARKTSQSINPTRIADFLLGLEGADTTSTFHENIQRLPQGTSILASPKGCRLQPYWELRPTQLREKAIEADFQDAFNDIFTEAVRCRLNNPVGTGISLSGGLDSSAIYGIAHQLMEQDQNRSPKTFSLISPKETNNLETQHIQSLINQRYFEAITVDVDQTAQQFDPLVTRLEKIADPFDWHMNLWRIVYDAAQKQSVHSMLDGVDGDLLLASPGLNPYLWRSGQVRAALGETLLAGGISRTYERPLSMLLLSLRAAVTPNIIRQLYKKIRQEGSLGELLKGSIINEDFARSLHLEDRITTFQSYDAPKAGQSLIDAHRNVILHPHLQAALERYDRVASDYSIHPLHPLLDVRLMQFCLSLPWKIKTERGWTKMAMRKMLEPTLPADVVWRKDKHHLGWSLTYLLLKTKGDYFYQIVDENRQLLESFINLKKLDQHWNYFLKSGDDKFADLFWYAAPLALWLRRQKDFL